MWYNRVNLKYQYEYAGNQLVNTRLLVSARNLDIPNPQLKARSVPADPVPVNDPRPENFFLDNNSTAAFVDEGGEIINIE